MIIHPSLEAKGFGNKDWFFPSLIPGLNTLKGQEMYVYKSSLEKKNILHLRFLREKISKIAEWNFVSI